MAIAKNDSRIVEYRKKVEQMRAALGTKPKCIYHGNGTILHEGKIVNLNTVTDLRELAHMLGMELMKAKCHHEGLVALDLPTEGSPEQCPEVLDIKMRATVVKWQIKERALATMEQQLAQARSTELATSDLLDDIGKALK